MARLVGAIEAGGTKFVCAVGSGPEDLHAVARFPATSPKKRWGAVSPSFGEQPKIEALGIGCFGPIDLGRRLTDVGPVTTTPKPGWSHTDVVAPLGDALGCPSPSTPTSARRLGEHAGAPQPTSAPSCYVTIGTGIGGGAS